MSSAAYTRWETFAGVVGVITSIPIAVTLVMIHLPSRKIDSLFLTLASVQASLEETVEEGLLREHHIRSFRQQLIGLRNRARDVRARAHSARDCTGDLTNMLKGLTTTITNIEDDAMELRATIATTSTREREERERAEVARRIAAGGGNAAAQGEDPRSARLYTKVWRLVLSTLHLMVSLLWRRSSMRGGNDSECTSLHGECAPPLPDTGAYSSTPSLAPPAPSFPMLQSVLHDEAVQSAEIAPEETAQEAPPPSRTQSSLVPSSRSRKSRSSPCSRTRAFAQFVRHYRRKYATPRHDDVSFITMSEWSSIEPLQDDDDAADWEDIGSRKVRVML